MAALAQNVRTLAQLGQLRSRLDSKAVANANRFASALEQAAAMSGRDPLIIYRSAAPLSILARARVLREELTHVEQFRKGFGTPQGHVQMERVITHPVWPLLKSSLLRNGYAGSNQELVAEAAAQLAAGQTAKLRINQLEAISFLTRYLGALADRHGVSGAEEVLQYAEPWIRRELGLKRSLLR